MVYIKEHRALSYQYKVSFRLKKSRKLIYHRLIGCLEKLRFTKAYRTFANYFRLPYNYYIILDSA